MTSMGWKGGALRAAQSLERGHNLALGFARMLGVPTYLIVHAQGGGGYLIVASEHPTGSGLPVAEFWTVEPSDNPMADRDGADACSPG